MAEYIDREKLIEAIHKAAPFHDGNGDIQYGLHIAENIIKEQLAADVQEVKRAKWVQNKPNIEKMREFHKIGIGKGMSEKSIFYTCSCCGGWGTPTHKYCNNCGAKMGDEVLKQPCFDILPYSSALAYGKVPMKKEIKRIRVYCRKSEKLCKNCKCFNAEKQGCYAGIYRASKNIICPTIKEGERCFIFSRLDKPFQSGTITTKSAISAVTKFGKLAHEITTIK